MDADGFTKIYSCNVIETCGPLRFHKDGKRVYFETNKGDAMDLLALVLLDPETGKTETGGVRSAEASRFRRRACSPK